MPSEFENIRCNCCGAMCQGSEGRLFELSWVHPTLPFLGKRELAFICELCLWPESLPIPFTVTEKGRAESMRQLAKEKENA